MPGSGEDGRGILILGEGAGFQPGSRGWIPHAIAWMSWIQGDDVALLEEIDKNALLEELRSHIAEQLDTLLNSQRTIQEGATHEESRAEDSKDTRATEASYLARGLAERVERLREDLARLEAFELRDFSGEDPIAAGALVNLEDEDAGSTIYILLPAAGGEAIPIPENTVRVLSPLSPLGQQLIGKQEGEDFEIDLPRGRLNPVISEVG